MTRIYLGGAAALAALLTCLLVLLAGGSGSSTTDPAVACGAPAASFGTGAIAMPMTEGSFRMTSGYGIRWGTLHAGVDLAAPIGTPIYAAHDGTVAAAGAASGFGLWVVVDGTLPDGSTFSTVYGHNNVNLVEAGQVVTAGQQIAEVGNRGQSTGPHLHFEVWPGTRLNGGRSVDPMGWLAANSRPGEPPTEVVAQPADPALTGAGPQGTQATMPIGAEQQANVEIMVGVVKGRQLPLRVAVLTVAAAMQESRLLNINYGDRDSLGLFQQRPSQGWGTPAQILDPVYSTGKFLDALTAVPGYETMPLTVAIQAAQRSGFPDAYAKWETQAIALVAASEGVDPITAGLGPALSTCV